MKAPARLLGHPIHQMLIVLPLGSLVASLVFDILNRATNSNRWADTAFWTLGFGVLTGLIAAVFGLVDWVRIPKGTRARRVGAAHGLGNVLAMVVFATSFALRLNDPQEVRLAAVVLSFVGGAIILVTGWLGGELVNRLGVGVHDDAHLDAPSSLKSSFVRPGSEGSARGRPVPGRDAGDEPAAPDLDLPAYRSDTARVAGRDVSPPRG